MEKEPNRQKNSTGFVWPIILVLAGTILLLNNFGVISWDFWIIVFRFWPLLLIIAGLENIFGDSFLGKLISLVIGIALLLFAVAYCLSAVNRPFDRWIRNVYPFWGSIQKEVPNYGLRQRTFRCSPFDPNCYRYFEN